MGVDIPLGKQGGDTGGPGKEDKALTHDQLLGLLTFSNQQELPKLVEKHSPMLDNSFFAYLDAKIAKSKEANEKETLGLFNKHGDTSLALRLGLRF